MTWERILVKRVGSSFIGEARHHAHFIMGEMCKTPEDALNSAADAMDKRFQSMGWASAPISSPPDDEELL